MQLNDLSLNAPHALAEAHMSLSGTDHREPIAYNGGEVSHRERSANTQTQYLVRVSRDGEQFSGSESLCLCVRVCVFSRAMKQEVSGSETGQYLKTDPNIWSQQKSLDRRDMESNWPRAVVPLPSCE